MSLKINVSLVLLLSFTYPVFLKAQSVNPGRTVPSSYCISPDELKLYNLINEYRKEYNLPPIPLSKSLSFVASTHVKDLYINHPDKGSCNFHSWSNKGFWTAFCYPRDENKKNSVWDKPKEICNYPAKGFEIVYWENNPVTFDSIIPFWTSIDYFNGFLMNTGKWKDKKWNAIGVAIWQNYAAAWFGEVPDQEGEPNVCGHPPLKKAEIAKKIVEPVKKQNPAGDSLVKKPLRTSRTVKPVVKKADTTLKSPAPEVKTNAGKPAVSGDSIPAKPVKNRKPVKTVPKIADTSGSVPVPVVPSVDHHKYFIIVSSQLTLAESKKLAGRLIKEGYPETKILRKDNKNRISIYEFGDKLAADSALRVVKKSFRDAWILK